MHSLKFSHFQLVLTKYLTLCFKFKFENGLIDQILNRTDRQYHKNIDRNIGYAIHNVQQIAELDWNRLKVNALMGKTLNYFYVKTA